MFAELHIKTHYSFLTGASSPEELVYQASNLGYLALAITDECSYSGIVKAFQASKKCGIKLIIGSEFQVETNTTPFKVVLLAPNQRAYTEISSLITMARCRSPKGEYRLSVEDIQFGLQHCLAIWLPSSTLDDIEHGKQLKRVFKNNLWVGVELFLSSNDQESYLHCERLSRKLVLPMVACNDVHMHHKSRKPLQDTLTAIRLNTTVQRLAKFRHMNAERYLKPLTMLRHQYPTELLRESVYIASLCTFSMDDLRYEYPRETVPAGLSPSQHLRTLTENGIKVRWPNGISSKMRVQIEHELSVIKELAYEYYFLTVHDIVRFARSKNILCQGRGSAANSAVCYCLFITEIDPNLHQLLFERFISKERNEPPDIDVDFESQRREEVIQYIYKKYSRKRTALTATVITYKRKSAIRDVGKALGLPLNFIEELNSSMAWWDKVDALTVQMKKHKLNIDSTLCMHFLNLVKEILGTPRHLSQHVGGFLITHSPTSTLVPIENAAMPNRTIIQWDKYDIEIMGLLKVDVLGLGMLSTIRRSLSMISEYQQTQLEIQDIPKEDSSVYDMLCSGDSLGVFQVESRAQMSMLPRLKPKNFYDLVVQVAIVRPGPIQGDMVHPYLKRRNGEEQVTYPNDEIKTVLKRTLGVPIFQEQVIQLTMVAAGFSGGQADELRRAMASWGKHGNLDQFKDKLITGMLNRGHSHEFADRIFKQIQGFGSYGFPESHSASFALLVYISSWIKRHHPAAFYAGILNSQPMGFYSPSQLIQDAKRHNIRVLPVCIHLSDWEHTLDFSESKPALRLGFRLVKGVSERSALQLLLERSQKAINSIDDVKQRTIFSSGEMAKLINANVFHSFNNDRRKTYWQALQIDDGFNTQKTDNADCIIAMSPLENMIADYRSTRGVSLNYHPMQLLRRKRPFIRCSLANQLLNRRNKSLIEVSGVVTGRQRPGTASGVIFMTLEDETGNINVILWKNIQERFRDVILNGRILYIKGTVEHQHGVANVIAAYIERHDDALPSWQFKSRDFH